MKVLSHRGYWLETAEKNQEVAFQRSFNLGFGTETDLRDCAGRILISHDMPSGHEMSLETFLGLVTDPALPLALNIKADGLVRPVAAAMEQSGHQDWFVFDMSVPDTLAWLRAGVPVFTRLSEYEPTPAMLDRATGVWLDAFEQRWWNRDDISRLLDAGRRVCIVSPELHARPHEEDWEFLLPLAHREGLMICTDLPEQARAFFLEVE